MELTDHRKTEIITKLSEELVVLRAKAGLSQEEFSSIIGLSRQAYSAFELKKKDMSWRTCFSVLMYFDYNPRTHYLLRALGLFPEEIDESVKV